MATFNDQVNEYLNSITELSKNNSVPKWIKPFLDNFKSFGNHLATHLKLMESKIEMLEGNVSIQKVVTDSLVEDRDRLVSTVDALEHELDEQQQYSRRTCLLVHGVKELPKENTDDVVFDIFDKKMEAGLTKTDITRSHRLGRKREGDAKPRPIIVRFLSYRQRKMVYDTKKKLKGQNIVVTENLTKKRYSLLRKCFDSFEKNNVWVLDGRIYCKCGNDNIKVFTKDEELNDFLLSNEE